MGGETEARVVRHAGRVGVEVSAEAASWRLAASSQLAGSGFEILENVLPRWQCEKLAAELSLLHKTQRESAGNRIGGLRNLLRWVPSVAELAASERFKSILSARSDKVMFPVRALFFDKTPAANWSVPWHQDLSIAVAERIETPRFSGWSIKEGIVHVQPARYILEGMLTIRLQLDDCDADNGALKVIPESHLDGKLEAAEISQRAKGKPVFVCEVSMGGALLMRPLLLHSSSQAVNPSHRRVLHLEYASDELPNGLKWFDR
jgi:Phytanoyl-CoA dioxygenase (PhyH)